MTIKTRFAPSPTGDLHIGGARTALFSWLYAKKMGGQFILRVEDTDQERSSQASVDAILDGMAWLGLEHDEGPIFQSDRFDRYKAIIQQLLDQGNAYHCYCSKEELDSLREAQMASKEKPRYNGKCRDHAEVKDGVEPVVRFRNPQEGSVVFDDAVRGRIEINNSELDDLIIARSNGTPTYNLCVVVDDIDMGVTHVVRGDDHINNTPRQVNIMHALGVTPPVFAHVPMILGPDGKRLSKRHGAVSVMQYRDDGYLPEAILNYLVRLGWSHGDQEIFSREEMIKLFDIKDVNKAPSAFNVEKSMWINQHYIKTLDADYVANHLQWHMQDQSIDTSQGPELAQVVDALKERAKSLKDLASSSRYFYEEVTSYDEKATKKQFKAETPAILNTLHQHLSQITDENWQDEPIHAAINAAGEEMDLKLGKVGPPLRLAVTGSSMSPSLDITLRLIGKQRSLNRIQQAIDYINSLH